MLKSSITAGPVCAGAARSEITPPLGTHLAGSIGVHRPAEAVLDPLYARAVVLENGQRKLCFLSLDVTIITRHYTQRIRAAAAAACGLEPDAIMVHATQTHSAQPIGNFMIDDDFTGVPQELEWLRGGEEKFFDFATERAVQAIIEANANIQPVQVGVASGIEGRMAYNRRAVKRDGKVMMPHGWLSEIGPTEILYMEGPMDPELGVLSLRTPAGEVVSLLTNYACHPVHVFPEQKISADWPGALCDELNAATGEQCTPLVLNGACGNINPWPPFDPDYVYNGDHRAMGSVLAETARKILDTVTYQDEVILDYRVCHLKLPYRDLDPEVWENTRRVLEAQPQPVPLEDAPLQVSQEWAHAAYAMSKHLERRREGELDYEIQVLRVGEAVFVSLPGEPFAEGGLQLKLNSPTYPTYIVHCTTQYIGYLPTLDAFPRGGHEVIFSKLIPEALDMIIAAALEVIHEICPDKAALRPVQ